MYPQSCFEQKYENNLKKKSLKIVIFTAVKYCSILHGHLCVMKVHERSFQRYVHSKAWYVLGRVRPDNATSPCANVFLDEVLQSNQ